MQLLHGVKVGHAEVLTQFLSDLLNVRHFVKTHVSGGIFSMSLVLLNNTVIHNSFLQVVSYFSYADHLNMIIDHELN